MSSENHRWHENTTHRKALLRANNMNNTLSPVRHAKVGQPECLHVIFQGCALCAGVWLNDKLGRGSVTLA